MTETELLLLALAEPSDLLPGNGLLLSWHGGSPPLHVPFGETEFVGQERRLRMWVCQSKHGHLFGDFRHITIASECQLY